MKIYFNKTTILLIICFVLIIGLLQTYHHFKFNYYKEKIFEYQLNEKILYISFLVHKKENQLQELLIDLSKDTLKTINLDHISTRESNKICIAWNDEVLRKKFNENVGNDKFNKTIKKLNKKCFITK